VNRSVLIVTPYFAPQSHAAVFRAYKLAKYLPRYGWKVHVLTTDTNYLYNEDPQLLEDLPNGVEITRVRYVEPTVRGLRMALGGTDRTFAALKRAARADHDNGTGPDADGVSQEGGPDQHFAFSWVVSVCQARGLSGVAQACTRTGARPQRGTDVVDTYEPRRVPGWRKSRRQINPGSG